MTESTDPAAEVGARAPRTYLGWAVLVTVVAFLPLGLVAVFHGLRARSALADGRLADAARSGRAARRWAIAAAIVGVLIDLLLIASLLLLGAYSS